MNDIVCPPYRPPDDDGPASIFALAARASAAANRYRRLMDERADFRETVCAASNLARATERLTAAIADAVAEGDGQIHLT